MKIEKIKITDIKENPNNPRHIDDDRFEKLKESINRFPKMLEIRPLIIDDNNIVMGGNMRLRALTELKVKETFIIRASNFTKEEFNEFLIKDNISYGEWDYDALLTQYDISTLYEYGLDIPNSELSLDNNDDFKPDEIDFSEYTIYFENEEEQEIFYTFLAYLKNKFKGHTAVSKRVISYIQSVYEDENMSESKLILEFLKCDSEIENG